MQDYSTPENMAIVHIATKQCILDYGDVVQVSCGIIVLLSVRQPEPSLMEQMGVYPEGLTGQRACSEGV